MISVIIPAYNAEGHISQCLSAIAAQWQTLIPREVIVVSDGSTDQTVSIARELGARVFEIAHQGPAAARNFGAEQAQGDILIFTDADCRPDVGWVDHMTRPFDDPDVVGVMGRYKTNQTGLTARFAQAEFEDRYHRMVRLPRIDLIATYSAAFRRSVFLSEGGFNTSFARADNEDVEFSYRLARKGHKLVFTPEACVFHPHPARLTKYLRQKFGRAAWRMVVYSFHPTKAIKDTYTPLSLKIQIILAWPLLVLAVMAVIWPFWRLFFALTLLLFLSTCLPFIRNIWHLNYLVAVVSPLFLFLRSLAFGLGIVRGLYMVWRGRP
ncbi:glycosyltransferase [bacterium]|nr:glycosyltransferase [bacterium]